MTCRYAPWAVVPILVILAGCASSPDPSDQSKGLEPVETPPEDLHHRIAYISNPDDGPAKVPDSYRHAIAPGAPPMAVAASSARTDNSEESAAAAGAGASGAAAGGANDSDAATSEEASEPDGSNSGDPASSQSSEAKGSEDRAQEGAESTSPGSDIPNSAWKTYCGGAPAALPKPQRDAIADWQNDHHATAPERFQPCRSPK